MINIDTFWLGVKVLEDRAEEDNDDVGNNLIEFESSMSLILILLLE